MPSAREGQKAALDFLELELRMAVSHQMGALNYGVISLALLSGFNLANTGETLTFSFYQGLAKIASWPSVAPSFPRSFTRLGAPYPIRKESLWIFLVRNNHPKYLDKI